MKNKLFLRRFIYKLFSPELEFRVRLFHVLAIGGTLVSFLMCVLSIINYSGTGNVIANAVSTALSFTLLMYSYRSGRYQLCYMVTIFGIFFGLFPYMFFATGGYHSGMPSFFVFAAVFTIFMLEGKKAVVFALMELLAYTVICIIAYRLPETVSEFSTEKEMLTDIVVAFTAVSIVLGACMFLHFKLYNAQQQKLDEQNRILAGVNKMKTELFANVSHEMKTPLTVVSVHIQRAEKLFEIAQEGDAEKIKESFSLARDEIMRMSRLMNSALELTSIQELSGEKQPLNIGGILRTGSEVYRALLEKNGNSLEISIPDNLPEVYGNADSLVHIISNLLSNANAHTQNGVIRLTAAPDNEMLTIAVEDTGEGIPPEILPYVFERGITGGERSGLGLFICRELVNGYGGGIKAESEPGRGTVITFTLPAIKKGENDE